MAALLTIMPIISCGKESPAPEKEANPNTVHVLVVYFSCTNTTKGIAEKMSELTDADLWRIVPQEPYTSDDLNYNNSSSRANREQNNPAARPAISGKIDDLSQYDVVFIGYPIWWGKAPKIINTFLESYDFAGKTIVPFCTSGSSGVGSSDTELHKSAQKATWKRGRRFEGIASKSDITNWINSLNVNL